MSFEKGALAVLSGPNSRRQLVVAGKYSSNQLHDESRNVTYAVSPPGIVKVSASGFVTPLADGEATVTAASPQGPSALLACKVESFDAPIPINFKNEIVPIFTKLGCNAGSCHGKSGGQNGFKLSLLGFYPSEDYEYVVKEVVI